MLTDPRTILTTITTLLEAVTLPDSFGDPAPAAFEAVRVYDLQDLAKALEELLVFKARCAFVLLENANHDTRIDGRMLIARRTIEVSVLLADRNWTDRQKALMGQGDTPGALLLGHLAVDALTGEQSGMIVEPGLGEIFALAGRERDNAAGRIAWRQEFRIPAGSLKKTLSRIAD